MKIFSFHYWYTVWCLRSKHTQWVAARPFPDLHFSSLFHTGLMHLLCHMMSCLKLCLCAHACVLVCSPEHICTWITTSHIVLYQSHTNVHMWLTESRKPAQWFASACVACGAGSAPSWTAAHLWGCREMCGLSSLLPPGNPSSPRGPSPSLSPWWPVAAGDWAAGEAAGAGGALGHRPGWGADRDSGP